jgi:UDP-N-acetyl-D-galactosamine dehydrogenase
MSNATHYSLQELKVCIVGLGYVGLPLAIAFSKQFTVTGFDIDKNRISELTNGIDKTLEISEKDINSLQSIKLTSNVEDIKTANCFIVTVPTPIDQSKQPNLNPLLSATTMIGRVLKKNDVVVYESTVYPGATEEECIPLLEKYSGLRLNEDFLVGYSPERINPGDKMRPLTEIKKITSGSSRDGAIFVDSIYKKIITAGTYMVESIRIAEAAKVIENTQRDLNIALMNEIAIILNRLGIDTASVLEAAGTKWNFLPFKPGLVGGHCIGVDPYYLTHKGQAIGCYPEIILAGRRLNDGMGAYVTSQLIKEMGKAGIPIKNSRVLIMGIAFKENCPDIRNSRIPDIVEELSESGCIVDIMDPLVDSRNAKKEYGYSLLERNPKSNTYDAIILAVPHDEFIKMGAQKIHSFGKPHHILYDVKSIFSKSDSSLRL